MRVRSRAGRSRHLLLRVLRQQWPAVRLRRYHLPRRCSTSGLHATVVAASSEARRDEARASRCPRAAVEAGPQRAALGQSHLAICNLHPTLLTRSLGFCLVLGAGLWRLQKWRLFVAPVSFSQSVSSRLQGPSLAALSTYCTDVLFLVISLNVTPESRPPMPDSGTLHVP